MASILFLAKDLPGAGRVEGDPVSVKGDREKVTTPSGDWHWSAEEDKRRWIAEGNRPRDFPDLFYVVDIPGLSKRRAERIMQRRMRPATIFDPEFNAPDREDRMIEIEKHRWRLNIVTRMGGPDRTRIRRNRVLVLENNRGMLNNLVRDRTARAADQDDWITNTPKDPVGPSRG